MAEVSLLKKLADAVSMGIAREHDAALRRGQELDQSFIRDGRLLLAHDTGVGAGPRRAQRPIKVDDDERLAAQMPRDARDVVAVAPN